MNNPIYESHSKKNCGHCIYWKPFASDELSGECLKYPYEKFKELVRLPGYLFTHAYHVCELFEKKEEKEEED